MPKSIIGSRTEESVPGSDEKRLREIETKLELVISVLKKQKLLR